MAGDNIVVWEVETGKQVWSAPGKLGKDEEQGGRFDWSADGKRVAWNEDGKITVADAADGKVLRSWSAEPGPVALAPDGGRLALGCADGTALVWKLSQP